MKNRVTLEEISADLINEAHSQWVEEDDGTDDYPAFGEVLAVRFGLPRIDDMRKNLEILRSQNDALLKRLERARAKTLKLFGLERPTA